MRIHVIGLGPIGSLVAFHLRRSLPRTIPITLVVKNPSRAREVRSLGGIAIESSGATSTQRGFDLEIFDPLEEVVFDLVYNKQGAGSIDTMSQPIDTLIVCTKAHSTMGILRRIRRRLTANSTIVLLQNGMGVYDTVVHELFRNPLERPQFVLATTTHAARTKTHGSLFHTIHVSTGQLSFGILPDPQGERNFEASKWDVTIPQSQRTLSLDDIAPSPHRTGRRDRCSNLRDTIAALSNLQYLKPSWEPLSELQLLMKRKLVVNSVINPLTALLQCSNGALYGNPHVEHISQGVCDEASTIFSRESLEGPGPDTILPPIEEEGPDDFRAPITLEAPPHEHDDAVDVLHSIPSGLRSSELQEEVMRIARRTSMNYSSMYADIMKNRPTEIDYLNGYLRRLGKFYGVATPQNNVLYNLIKLREKMTPAVRI
ncbi:hypothetical protein M422DRAFT_151989 [Sphaerobolus stellatus SS14]|nr:hypothetical protein M422DRAFT_151989 [Sphaerobolus stellatus SS14]